MQQTEFLKLNLIEGSDNVDWAPLNENAKALEAEAKSIRTAVTAMAANLGSGGSNVRMAAGSYIGTGGLGADEPNSLTFDFEPWVIYLSYLTSNGTLPSSNPFGTFLRPLPQGLGPGSNAKPYLTWGENSVSWYSDASYASSQSNTTGTEYFYLALGKPIVSAV